MSTVDRLQQIFLRLSATDQSALLAFAEFLQTRNMPSVAVLIPETPVLLPRAADETVVGAIKRLRRSYPMLDQASLLNEVSTLMGQYTVQGRPLNEVIDALEALFARHYQIFMEQ